MIRMRSMRSMIILAVLGALVMVALVLPATIPASADDDDRADHHRNHHRHGGHDLLSLGSGGKITVKLLQRGESETLAEIYASENTGKKVERAMRRGLRVHCHPGGYDTLTFTCEGATPPPEATTPETTVPETTVPETTVPATTP